MLFVFYIKVPWHFGQFSAPQDRLLHGSQADGVGEAAAGCLQQGVQAGRNWKLRKDKGSRSFQRLKAEKERAERKARKQEIDDNKICDITDEEAAAIIKEEETK